MQGIDSALQIYDSLPSDYFQWKLYYGGVNGSTQNFIDECNQDMAANKDMARARLKSVLVLLSPGTYRLDIKRSLENTKNFRSIEIFVNHRRSDSVYSPAIGNQLANQPMNETQIAELVKKETEKIHLQYEMKAMEAKIKELTEKVKSSEENTAGAAIGKFINSDHGKLLAGVLAQKLMGGQTVGIAGKNDKPLEPLVHENNTEINEPTADDLDTAFWERISDIIEKFILIEGDRDKVENMLNKLLQLHEEKPDMYAMAKTFLN